MSKNRFTVACALACALLNLNSSALLAQQRRSAPRRTTAATTATRPTQKPSRPTRAQQTKRKTATRTAATRNTTSTTAAADARLTGLYRLDFARSDDPREAAERATTFLAPDEQERIIESLTARLTSPDQLAIERRGQSISIASTRAPRVTFEADGRTRTEQAEDGHPVTTRAALYGDQLMISSAGSPGDDFSVNFDSINNGARLRVTRRIHDPSIDRPVVVQSIYNKVSGVARFSIYGEPEAARTTSAARSTARTRTPAGQRRTGPTEQARTMPVPQQQPRQRPAPPVFRREPEQPPAPRYEGFVIGRNTQFVATLNDNLSTESSREGDRFTLTVREPSVFAGAIIEGRISRLERGGRISGRSEMLLAFDTIRLPDGRTAAFDAVIESVRAAGDEEVRVDNEGGASIGERDSQTARTTERAAIGAAVGAIIGAISGGRRGAAIGAIVGAGAGAGSVYAQGRDDLELGSGTELILRAEGSN